MSPLAFHRKLYTPVRLNPPIFSVSAATTSTPTSIGYSGSVTLSGVATLTYPNSVGVGTVGYEWREGSTVIAVGTAATLTNLKNPPDNGRIIKQFAVYYPNPSRVGVQTFEPEASNSPFEMGTVVLNVKSLISITSQPDTDTPGVPPDEFVLDISPAGTDGRTSVDFTTEFTSYSSFATGTEYTLTPRGTFVVRLTANGAAGGKSIERSVAGGLGGNAVGNFIFELGKSYKLRVGGKGVDGGAGGYSGGGRGGGGSGAGGGGGGFTGLFESSVTQSNAIIIAGGAGGGANDPAGGGNGGGLSGGDGGNAPGRGGGGATQTSGGLGGQNNGTALQGGPGAAGGGGGYFGGAGGNPYQGCCADGAGGGGSGYLHPSKISNGSFGGATATGDGNFTITRI